MRVLLQRVSEASVSVEQRQLAAIGAGLVLLVGVGRDDTPEDARRLADKVARLRLFEDDSGKMNRSAIDDGVEILLISQFTLYADTSHGRRPGFTQAALPDVAEPLVELLGKRLGELGLVVRTGQFGAHMLVRIHNDGPVTIWLES